MKAYWHTKTLFIQAGKYKWAYHYDHCIECWKVDKPHKWRWLCTRCWDKQRDSDPRRKQIKLKASRKFSEKKRIPLELQKKRWNKWWWTPEDKKAYQKQWHYKWKEAIIILNKWKIWERKWLILPKYKWKPIPFEIWPKWKDEKYENYKERMRKYEVVKSYIDK